MKLLRFVVLITFTCLVMMPFKAQASEFNFSVTTIIPDNQMDSSKTYFHLQLDPGAKQTVEILLRNDTDNDVVIAPDIGTASTNVNGVVEYGNGDQELDESLLYPMEDLVTTEEEIVVPANGEYTLPLDITMPDDSFDGVMAGGVTLQETVEEENKESTEQGLSINNQYAYVVGIVLQQTENPITPDLLLHDVYADQLNARNVIMADIQNPKPMYMNQLAVQAVIKNDSNQTVLESETDGMQMAPNSHFSYPIPLEGKPLEAGDYRIELTASSMGEEWHWNEPFTIDEEQAEALNQTDVSIPATDYTWLYVALGIACIVIAFLLILYYQRKKHKKQLHEAMDKQRASAS
ncbi:DUF916 and DUF3324 domain-containing protein [Shouchella miscanthi]|uniref:DUF916 and DUF3324 domain-containing protein n=1 Tax=Shouchella miscanthi TaxID=2598861 RepID=A0ABU6NP75_9BACI|nr:DUF916 and DUF3324 domain-containing protein [Shouchella miscanthi]MED4130002.1 DUF916 and DUF3324 domain-containing protein [Shouchella miscanthi]